MSSSVVILGNPEGRLITPHSPIGTSVLSYGVVTLLMPSSVGEGDQRTRGAVLAVRS